ncbi:MAG: YIP1 family protein [Chitinivibrionales bacterium]|nr:YIP1 family protein [Chitinivibrionales bacterium]
MPQCNKCNTLFDANTASPFCSLCGAPLDMKESPEIVQTSAPYNGIPWEQTDGQTNLLSAFVKTVREVLFHPTVFFQKLQPGSRWWWPLLFALVCSSVSAVAVFAWNQVLLAWLPDWLAAFEPYLENQSSLLWAPFLCVAEVLFSAVSIQLMLVFFHRRQRADFSMTFRMVCYMQSNGLLLLLPFVGIPVSAVWGFYLLIAGLHSVHRMSKFKAVVIVVAPMVLLICVVTAGVAMVVLSGLFTLQLFKDFIANFRY